MTPKFFLILKNVYAKQSTNRPAHLAKVATKNFACYEACCNFSPHRHFTGKC